MRIGIPKEIKNHEYRVGMTPASARELASRGHQVLMETGAGAGVGMTDAQYRETGAVIAPDAATVFAQADMIALALADKGWHQAMRDDDHLREGLNGCAGKIMHPAVALALGYEYFDPQVALA